MFHYRKTGVANFMKVGPLALLIREQPQKDQSKIELIQSWFYLKHFYFKF